MRNELHTNIHSEDFDQKALQDFLYIMRDALESLRQEGVISDIAFR